MDIEKQWLKGLLAKADKVKKSRGEKDNIVFWSEFTQLMGYIETAECILDSEERKSKQPNK